MIEAGVRMHCLRDRTRAAPPLSEATEIGIVTPLHGSAPGRALWVRGDDSAHDLLRVSVRWCDHVLESGWTTCWLPFALVGLVISVLIVTVSPRHDRVEFAGQVLRGRGKSA